VIVLSVRWYLRFALSYRDVEELLAERGIDVDHTTVYRRVQRFTSLLTEAARPRRHAVVTAGRSMRPMSRSRASALRLPRDRPVRASHRRVRVPAAGRGSGPPVLPTRHRHDAGRTSRGDHRPRAGVPGGARGVAAAAWHRTDRYANNHIEADHGRLKSRLHPMRGLKQDRSARVIIAGHAFMQNLRRGHYELAVEEPVTRRVAVTFDELTVSI
jgi:hypothetical protein